MGKLSHRWFAQPDWWVAVFTGTLAAITVATVFYARGQIKETRAISETQLARTRHGNEIQHLLELVKEFDQEPMATYRKGLANKRLNTKDDDPLELYRVLDFFETVGRLVDRGYLDEDDVWNQFGYWVLYLNEDSKMRDNVESEHKQDPNEYAMYLKLVARLQGIDKAQGDKFAHLSDKEVMDFYREETTIEGGTPIAHGRAHTGKR